MLKKFTLLVFFTFVSLFSFGQLKKVVNAGNSSITQTINPPVANLYKQGIKVKKGKAVSSFRPLNLAKADPRLIIKYADSYNNIWIEGTPESIIQARTSDPSEQLSIYLKESSPLLSLIKAEEKFILQSSFKDDIGESHFKMQQYHKGIKIYGAEIILHGKERITRLNGKPYSRSLDIDVQPKLTPVLAIKKVKDDIPEFTAQINDPFNIMPENRSNSELIIYPSETGISLAYHISIHSTLVDRWEYIIDAHTGDIIKKYQSICKFHNHKLGDEELDGQTNAVVPDLYGTMRDINTFEVNSDFFMIDASRTMYDAVNSTMPNEPVGVIWTIDAFNTAPQKDDFYYDHVLSSDNTWSGKQTAVSAHYNAGTTYEYFKNTHNRESINGSGSNIISLVNIADSDGSSLENAFWNGVAMFYGNGGSSFDPMAKGLDVAAHEISHGVIQNTANLEYKGESGALNESYADIFGVLVDRDDWLIGEDVVKPAAFPSGALRSMMDPHNGAAQNDYGRGFQPKKVSEQFTGPEDNGGVHINSGIPNHAFYLFANNVGKDKAEQVYYRALTTYLLKSSQFIDQRLAVVQSTIDLYGEGNEAQAARAAFDAVEIFDGEPGDYQEDIETNPGEGFLLLSDNDKSNMYVYNENLNLVFNPFSTLDHISKPSINDDGSVVVFIGADRRMYYIIIDWDIVGHSEPTILQSEPIWRNVIISKDGRRLAALFDDETPRIWVYDFELEESNVYDLFNPTFTEGVSTGDVKYPDALEFDFSGDYIMYDALNEITSTTSGSIEYWDVGFLKIWNSASDFWSLGSIEKLFSALPEGISVGNPTFSKNSDYIIAFEVIQEGIADIYGANLQTGEVNVLFNNTVLSYPAYNISDTKIVHDLNIIGDTELGELEVDETKINTIPNSESFLVQDSRWGVWFANGQRDFSSSLDPEERLELIKAYPNPTADALTIGFNSESSGDALVEIYGVDGKRVFVQNKKVSAGINSFTEDVSVLEIGMYLCRIRTEGKWGSFLFFKQ